MFWGRIFSSGRTSGKNKNLIKNFIKIKIKKQLKSLTIDLKAISGKFFELFGPQLYTYAFDTQFVN